MGLDEPTHSNLEPRNPTGIPAQKAGTTGSKRPFSTRSRARWKFGFEPQDEDDTESWATENMKGHILLVRNTAMVAANVIAQRNLEARIYDLSRERYECLRSSDRERELFLSRLRMKGGRLCEMVSDVEAKRKSRSKMNGLYAVSAELIRLRSGTNGDARTIQLHALPFSTTGGEDKTQQEAEREEEEEEREEREAAMLIDDENISSMRPDIRTWGSQSACRFNSARHLDNRLTMRSFSALPVTRGRRRDYLPTKGPSIRNNGIFVPASKTPQPASTKLQTDEFGVDNYADRPKSCVFSDVCRRSLMSEIPECAQVMKLIDDIDSLHLPPRIQKKVKPKSDAVLRDIFRL